jgi:hypothetical protein
MTIAKVTHLPNGQWRFDETDALDNKPGTRLDTKLHPLTHEMALKSQQPAPDADLKKSWANLGYKRLAH